MSISPVPRIHALVCVAGSRVGVRSATSRTPRWNSMRVSAAVGEASQATASTVRRTRESTFRACRLGGWSSARPSCHSVSASVGRTQLPSAASPGHTSAFVPGGTSTRKKRASKRIGMKGGVTQRPAGSKSSASTWSPSRPRTALKVSLPSSSDCRAAASVAGSGVLPRAASTPVSSKSSRAAAATSLESGGPAPSTGISVSPASTRPPGKA